jgi:hypothetical protein
MIKNLLLPALFGAMSVLAITSCESDPCKDLEGKCGTGTCFEGACVCEPGYEKDAEGSCTLLVLDRIGGAYSVVEDCSNSNAATYLTAVTKVDVTTFKITNFWGLFQNQVTATIESDGSFKIARQEPDNDKFFVEGTGTLGSTASGKATITWNYSVRDETNTTPVVDNCTATVFTQQ